MSVKLRYHQAFSEVVLHALLHIEMHRVLSGRFIPMKRCNEWLVKYLKSRVNEPEYLICKKDIKSIIHIARKGGDALSKLHQLNQMNLEYRARFSQADELYLLLSTLYEQHGFPSLLINEEKEIACDTLYMAQEEIESGFDEENHQIKPLAFRAKSDEPQNIIEAVAQIPPYFAVVERTDEQGMVHFKLCRADSPSLCAE